MHSAGDALGQKVAKATSVLRSSAIIKYIFDIVLFSKSSLDKTLSNICLILVDERSTNLELPDFFLFLSVCVWMLWRPNFESFP